ncbi:MAG: zinc metallopeptidase [Gammaproteobacteria bacterium]|nr:zinc metallopeptidase [Gammaproteobacteria bacterium]
MLYVIAGIALLLALIGPQWWTAWVMRRHGARRDDLPGTGAELARHLLDRFDLKDVKVEQTERGDHYDPTARTVRLGPDHFDGKSLTAVAVASHEVGHALQHAQGYRPLVWRTRMAVWAGSVERLGAGMMVAIPVISLISKNPRMGLILLAVGIFSMFLATLVHLVTLPVEWNASFRRALPVLEEGYLSPRDMPAARQVLRAAAWTYVAGSLASLLNIARWIAILRRR